ncbi:hypothetical protein LUZ61_014290 [Rhynchospora tenuis]|uniref:RING-type E3 ubiquitin transferase n=1 Tax=Rhynchospora tenuis TaxID=198213 RepID=A0AAD5WAR9_9POAL|nr:hypothetical protein LUZ61_014290 [Rhynchospora tenuis]
MSGKDSISPAPQPPPTPPLPPTATVETVPFNTINTNSTSNTINFPYSTQGSSSNGGASTYTRFFFVAITCLCLVASFVLFLHLYLRYVRRRHLQHHRRQTANIFRLTTFNHTQSDSPRTGLDRAAISSIPSFQYQKEASRSENGNVTLSGVDECAVCLSSLEEGEVVRMLPACRHVFHVACIDKWLTSSASCPVCRADVLPQMQVQGRSRSQSLSRSQSAVGEVTTDAPVQDQSRTKEEAEVSGSASTRLSSSFRRMLSVNRSSRRVQDDAMVNDLERGNINGANSND